MSEDFRVGCRAKVERADEHIQDLKSESDRFLLSDPKPYRIVRQSENEGRAYVWYGFEDRAVPPIIPILAGEAIHQLRSSLDHLVVAMVRERGNNVTSDHAFPITKERDVFKAARDRGQIKGISLAAQDLIESMQPYNTRDGFASSILWTLHRQDIEDKHRLLVVVNAAAFMDSVTIDTPEAGTTTIREMTTITFPPRFNRMTNEGVELMRIGTGEANPHFDPKAEFSTLIAFEEFGTIQLNPVLKALGEARDFVVQTINRFAGEFAVRHDASADVAVRDKSYLRPGGTSAMG